MEWIQLLNDYRISYVTRSVNTKRGEVSVRCPWCGEDDPSHHLGISLTTENWGCLRSMAHRGHRPHSLVAALLGCSKAQARLIVAQYSGVDPDSFGVDMPYQAPNVRPLPAKLPDECRLIRAYTSTHRFWVYLRNRKFDNVDLLTSLYGLKCCQTGKYANRIIIPVYEKQKLIGFQGRYIYAGSSNTPRYLSSGEAVKHTVFNADVDGNVLYICEGPFDALKIDFYGRDFGHRAVCTFGVSLTETQRALLYQTAKRFKKVVLLFDTDALGPTFELSEWLPVTIGSLPNGSKDPGELSQKQVEELINAAGN